MKPGNPLCCKKVSVIYGGTWPGYDWNDPNHKWMQMIEEPAREAGIFPDFIKITDNTDRRQLLSWIDYRQPDIILWVKHGNGLSDSVSWYKEVMNKTRGTTYAIWFDCSTYGDIASAEEHAPFVDFIINIDRTEAPKGVKDKEKYVSFPCGYASRFFYNPRRIRDIPVTFAGEIAEREDRQNLLRYMKEEGINVITSHTMGNTVGGDHSTRPSIKHYAEMLQRSVVTLNLPPHPTNPIINGKVWESIACGACLINLDHPGSLVKTVLVPDKEYISCKSFPEMKDKILFCLDNAEYTTSISRAGEKAYWKRYFPASFWFRLLYHAQFGILPARLII